MNDLLCVRCASQCVRTPAVSIADGNAVCGKHLWGHLFGGRAYSGWLEPEIRETS
jgi:hypothetical protein